MTVLSQNNSIIKSLGGDILDPAATVNNKILHIDTDLQFPNRIHKSATDNKVKQITDKAQGIIFAQSDVNKQPVYEYTGRYSMNGKTSNAYATMDVNFTLPDLRTSDFRIRTKFLFNNNGNTNFSFLLPFSGSEVSHFYLYKTGVYVHFFVWDNDSATVKDDIIFSLSDGSRWGKIIWLQIERKGQIIKFYAKIEDEFEMQLIYTMTLTFTNIKYNVLAKPLRLFGDIWNNAANAIDGWVAYYDMDYGTEFFDTFGTGNIIANYNPSFHHYQRYPDNGTYKAFFSSKYLKDAVIDSADNAQKINSSLTIDVESGSLQTPYLYQPTQALKPKLTKSGFKFTRAGLEWSKTTNNKSNGLPSGKYWYYYGIIRFVSFWHMPTSSASNQEFFSKSGFGGIGDRYNIWYNYGGNNKYLFYDGNFNYSNKTYSVNSFNHVAIFEDTTQTYVFINGILELIYAKIGPTTVYNRIDFGSPRQNASFGSDGYIDDILARVTSPIDPAGKAIGFKCFEPPTRGGFDGTFKIY